MLTDKQIAKALDLIDDRYHDVITKYLQKVGKTINEIGHLNQSSINLLIQLRRMGVDVKAIERELQKVTRLTKQDIKTLYRKAAQEANTDARFEYVTKGVEPDSVRWESLVEDIWKQTAGVMDNMSNSTIITDGYRNAIDDAVQAVTMGVSDYNTAIRQTVRRIGREGLQVEYESTYIASDGQLKHRRRRLDSAVRQNILDGIRQVQQKAQELIGEEIGADGVDITAHPNSAPDHEPVQGRRFDLANFQRMQSGLDFKDVDANTYEGFERPITQWRCRHLIFYILLGVTRRMYTDDQLDSWQQKNQKGCIIDGKHYTNYEATQLLRNLETEIRKQKDTAVLAKTSGDDVLRRECQSNINKLTKKYNSVAEAAGLRKQMEKTYVERFTPVEENIVANAEKTAIIEQEKERTEVLDVQKIADIDIAKYSVVAPNIRSSTLVLTENQKEHIIKRRGQEFFDKYAAHFADIAKDPDYIFPDKAHPNTAIACKTLEIDGSNVNLVIRLAVQGDDEGLENSVITAIVESKKRYAQRLRNNIPLYKKE